MKENFPLDFLDCRIFCYKLLLLQYEIEVKDHELIGLGEGIDFKLINVSPSTTAIYCPFGRTMDLEYVYSQKKGVPITIGHFCKGATTDILISQVRDILSKYGMFVVNIDRYYLGYLECERAHMGYHTILVKEYHDEERILEVYDALAKGHKALLSFKDFISGVFSECAISGEAEFYYLGSFEQLQDNSKEMIETSLLSMSNRLLKVAMPRIRGYLENMESLEEKRGGENQIRRYVEIQKKLFLNTLMEQEIHNTFYRASFFDFLNEYAVYDGFVQEMRINYQEVLERIHHEYMKGDSEHIFKDAKQLINIEKKLYERIYDEYK